MEIKEARTIAGGGSIGSLLAGNRFEFLQRASNVQLYAIFDGTGIPGTVLLSVSFTNVVLGEDLAVNKTTAVGTGPSNLDDGIADGVGVAGDRIIISIRNTDSVNAANVRVRVVITEV